MNATSLFKILFAIPVLNAICYGQECDLNGISCINCTDYQQCSGGIPSGPIFSCKNGAKCDENALLEHCWIKLNCFALNECSEIGIFPDATVDSNYFVCLPDSGSGFIKYEFTCPDGEFFDKDAQTCLARDITSETTLSPSLESTTTTTTTTTTTQTPPITSEPTPSPTPETTKTTTQTPPITSEPTPSPTPETTKTTTQTPPITSEPTPSPTPETTKTTTQTAPPITSASTSSPTPETTTAIPTMAPTSSPSPFACTAPGIFPNPTNCKMYFRCSTSLKVFNYICPGTSYFNENILKCSLIITPACQQQILQNTTTSTTPMTTSSTITRTPVPAIPSTTTTTTSSTTTRTPVPTIPSTTTTTTVSTTSTITTTTPLPKTTTTTTQVPPTPFACSAAGTFENPLDCKTYYRCSSNGKTFLYVCPNGSYYNEFTKRCGLTITPRCRSKLSK